MNEQKIEALWGHVHTLTVLATAGSFTAAAQRLGISKAAMSGRISELERAAGVPLVSRTTRSVRLTEAGQSLVDGTRDAYGEIERQFAGVRDLAGQPSGLLRITAPVALGRQQLVPLLPAFLRQYPELRLHLDLSDRLQPLAQEGFDLAIRHTTTVPQTHVAWKLCDSRSVLVASKAYLRRRPAPGHPSQLAEHDCLYYPRSGEAPAWSFEPAGQRRGERISVAVRGSFAANNSEAIREAALGGVGIALLPDFSAQKDLQSGSLVTLLPAWQPVGAFGNAVHAIRPYSPQVPRGVKLLVEHLRARLSPGFGVARAAGPAS